MSALTLGLLSGTGAVAARYVAALALLATVPMVLGEYRMLLANIMLVNVIAVLGLVVLLGWSGQFAFTSAAFMGLGAYSGGRLASLMPELPLEAALLVGTATGAVIGVLFGALAVRVRGYYLAIVTVAFMYVLQLLARHGKEVTGGDDGFLITPPTVRVLGQSLFSTRAQYYVGLFLVATVLAFVMWLRRTPLARGWVTLKSDDRFAEALGINVYRSRLAAFIIASAIFGLAGTWSAMVTQFVNPETFGFDLLLTHFIFLVVGGVTSPLWSALAASGLTVVAEYVRGFSGVSEMVYGAILLFSVLVMRQGLYGLFHSLTKVRERWT